VIAGHSYGAIVAFELTRQLRRLGSPVAACVLLDCGVPDRRILRGPLPLGQVVTGQEDAVRRGKELVYAAHALLGLRPRPHRVTTERMQAALWGMTLYQPAPVDVPLVVVRAADGGRGRDFDGWRAHTTASCTLVDVPGDHHSILAPPHLHALADVLREALPSGRVERVRAGR
jgi:thioesterase domain-containing protein